jgi:hypothetical protein
LGWQVVAIDDLWRLIIRWAVWALSGADLRALHDAVKARQYRDSAAGSD